MDEQSKIPEKPSVSRKQHLSKLFVCKGTERQ